MAAADWNQWRDDVELGAVGACLGGRSGDVGGLVEPDRAVPDLGVLSSWCLIGSQL